MLSIPLFTNLYVHVMYVSNTIEWNRKLIVIYEVLTFVMVPTQCQHLSIDSYLEEGTDGSINNHASPSDLSAMDG